MAKKWWCNVVITDICKGVGVVMYNLLYINTHDTGRMISPYGVNVPTEHFMKLAQDATLFTHAYCCGPTCSPSRASMLTGTYPHQNGMLGLAQRGFSLNDSNQHLANYLKINGYQTALSGIQHECGWYLDIDKEALHKLGYEKILTESSEGYPKEELHIWDKKNVEAAISWLGAIDKEKPFMLSYGMHSTHRPYPVQIDDSINENYVKPLFPLDSNEITRHDQAQFLTSVKHADENVSLLIGALKEYDLYDNTVIVYTTDHGVANPFHKCGLKDDGIGVSLIIRHPEKGHGQVYDHLISHIDIFPTICDMLGVRKPEYLEGLSYAAVFGNLDKTVRNEIFAEVNFHTSYEPMRCIRNERYKYIRFYDQEWTKLNLSNIDESPSKEYLMKYGLAEKTKPMEALYDCMYDSHEINNLIEEEEMQEVVKELKSKLYEQMVKTNDPLLNGPLEIKKHYKVNKASCLTASSKDPQDYDSRGRVI